MSSQGTVAIPSSTVVAIGAGFVGFALCVLSSLFLFRVGRLKLDQRRRRRNGENITFREIWNNDGGMWGFLAALNGESSLVGAGGRSDLAFVRLRNEIRLWEYYKSQSAAEMVRPRIWEIEIQEKGIMRGEEELVLDRSVPLGAMPSEPPENVEHDEAQYDLLEPLITLSVLVVYPSKPVVRQLSGSDEWLEIPEMVVGTTRLVPYTTTPLRRSRSSTRHEVQEQSDAEGDLDKVGSEKSFAIDQYLPELPMEIGDQPRRAGWRKIGKRWAIEGINDQDPEPEAEQGAMG